jgi:hypothetical protein
MKDEALKNERPDRSERKRIPLGQRNRISFDNKEDGYHYHMINDKDDRIQKALEGGYEHVESDKNLGDSAVGRPKKMGRNVSMPVGNGVTAYLMRIKQEWYDADQKEKQKVVDASEQAMKPNKAKNEYGEGLVTEKL